MNIEGDRDYSNSFKGNFGNETILIRTLTSRWVNGYCPRLKNEIGADMGHN